MNRFSLLKLLFGITIIALTILLVVSGIQNHKLVTEISDCKNTISDCKNTLDSYKMMLDDRHRKIKEQYLGTSLVVELARNQNQNSTKEFLDFLRTINPEALSFNTYDLQMRENLSVYCFSEAKYNPDFSERTNYQPKSLCLLMKNDSKEIIDHLMGRNGLISVSFSSFAEKRFQHTLIWELEDGTRVEYSILETGFKKI